MSRPATCFAGAQAAPRAEVCVVHLARHANGIEPFARFVGSYRAHPAGVEHELAIVLKGFPDRETSEPYRQLAGQLCMHWLEVPDDGFDLGSYVRAAGLLGHRRLAFLNSFSAIRAGRWLEQLCSLADGPQVGAVGASGSWGSQSSHVRYDLRLGGPYRKVFSDPEAVRRAFGSLSPSQAPEARAGRLAHVLQSARGLVGHSLAFPAFPAPHLRSNGLLIDRELWLAVCDRLPRDKLAAYRLESGRRGLTARLTRRGLRVLVAGRDGIGYEPQEWPASRTFWQGEQENLLVEDNQTRAYERSAPEVRRVLAGYAWGSRAASAQPAEAA